MRVDQIDSLDAMPAGFVDEPGKTLVDYLAWNKARGQRVVKP
jgi:hypothetical protein